MAHVARGAYATGHGAEARRKGANLVCPLELSSSEF